MVGKKMIASPGLQVPLKVAESLLLATALLEVIAI
jgi:hypothetical protein